MKIYTPHFPVNLLIQMSMVLIYIVTQSLCRLESYDRNRNFLPPAVLLPEPLDVTWPSSGFQQLNPDHKKLLPYVTRDQTEAYFLHRLAGFHKLLYIDLYTYMFNTYFIKF